MQVWTWPAYVGVLGGVALFLATLVPILVVQARRYGATSGLRLVGAAGLSIWVVALVAYTLVLSPTDPHRWCDLHAVDTVQLRPFNFLRDIARTTEGMTLRRRLLAPATLQVLFNVLLFVPLGAWCRRFFSLGTLRSIAVGFGVSLAVEATQRTGVWGLFPCAYRLADVDDLLANTTGAALGALGSWFVLGWMPSSERLEAARLRPRPVTRRRRLLGIVVDVALYLVGFVVVATLVRAAERLGGDRAAAPDLDRVAAAVAYLVPAAVVFLGPALVGWGGSLGQRLVWLAPARPDGSRPGLGRRLVRASVTGTSVAVAAFLSLTYENDALDRFVLVWPPLSVAAALAMPRGRGLSFLVAGLVPADARLARGAGSGGPASDGAAPGRARAPEPDHPSGPDRSGGPDAPSSRGGPDGPGSPVEPGR